MKLTRIKIFFLFVILAAVIISGFVYAAIDESTFVPYENPDYGITISYPQNWIMQENVMGTTAMFSPLSDGNDQFHENVNVVIQNLSSQPLSLDEYTRLSLKQIQQYITDAKILTSGKTKLAGNDAFMIVYTGKQGQFQLKWKQVWSIQDNLAYVISYTALDSDYDKYLESVDYMIESFKISD